MATLAGRFAVAVEVVRVEVVQAAGCCHGAGDLGQHMRAVAAGREAGDNCRTAILAAEQQTHQYCVPFWADVNHRS